MNAQRIHISIAFGDAILPVIHCSDGHRRVPLKPICEQVGVDWRNQRRKIADGTYLNRRLGVKVEGASALTQEQICIRIDRVEAYLNTLNPENIRSQGNGGTADWLEAKHAEWDDALHAYETDGFAVKGGFGGGLLDAIKAAKSLQEITNPQRKAALEAWLDASLAAAGHALPPSPQGVFELAAKA